MTDKLITANSLGDGLVVFLTPDGGWSRDIAEARVIGPAEIDAALAYGKAQHDARIVVEPYEIETTVEDGIPVPVRLRERIRAVGPTVAYGEAELAERAAASKLSG
jgi:sulfite reductase (NADPH) hemoprotein beta-component